MASRVSIVGALSAAIIVQLPYPSAAQESAPAAAPLAIPRSQATPPVARRPFVRAGDQRISTECKVQSPAYEGRAPLRAVRRAVLEKRPVRVVSIGSSSIVGAGASSPLASYPVRLESGLEGVIEGLKVEMFARDQSGEVAEGAADRFKAEIAEIRPDLVVWQVGTNDAVARIDAVDFGDQLRETLTWLASHRIDVVLIDPQYIERLSNDSYYTGIVNEIATVASEKKVLLVNRYDTMADLSRQHPGSSKLTNDRFQLNDLGYHCMAEYATKAIVSGILQADRENGAMH
jgi:lysophospholipase L1-like esterase